MRCHDDDRADEATGRRPRRRATPDPAAHLLLLQRHAGNRAVAGWLSRSSLTDVSTAVAGAVQQRDELDRRLRPAVIAYLAQQRADFALLLPDRLSMPEIVDMVRTNVPDARQLDILVIEQIVEGVFGPGAIRPHRVDREGMQAELAAHLRNAMGDLPTEVRLVQGEHGYLRVSVSGVEAGLGPVRAQASPSGGQLEVKGRRAGVTASVGADYGDVGRAGRTSDAGVGTRFGIEGHAGPVRFAGAVAKDDRGDWARWSFEVGFPELGARDPDFEAVTRTMNAAGRAMTEIVRRVQAGASPTDRALATSLDVVQAGMEAIAEVAERRTGGPGVGVGIQAEGRGDEVRALATVTIRF